YVPSLHSAKKFPVDPNKGRHFFRLAHAGSSPRGKGRRKGCRTIVLLLSMAF
ncbi:MAG: hypothetical protein ACI8V0_003204, partial [Pseudohongiellaceae bacterium]